MTANSYATPKTRVPDSLKQYRRETHDVKFGDSVKVGANLFYFYGWRKDGTPRFLSRLAFERWTANNRRRLKMRDRKKKGGKV